MSAIVNAKLFTIVNAFISTEDTRYCLHGVFIERHQTKGVYLVATDGHRLMAAHDENGTTDLEPIIVRLDKTALAACKAGRHEPHDRKLRVEGDGEVSIFSGNDDRISIFQNCIIDETFPDWKRVVPRAYSNKMTAGYDANHIADFGKASSLLANVKTGHIRLTPNEYDPALVRFPVDHAFGLVMPVRMDQSTLPKFFLEPSQPTWTDNDEKALVDQMTAK